jgi:hypothetical protein
MIRGGLLDFKLPRDNIHSLCTVTRRVSDSDTLKQPEVSSPTEII